MSGRKSYKPIEVEGEKYLCSLWFSDKGNVWYGQSFETSHYPPVCQGESKEALVEKLKEQIIKDLGKD